MERFFTTIGPRINTLELRNVCEQSWKILVQGSKSLVSLRHLNLDLASSTWDWDGAGSPQQGATENYVWEHLGCGHRIRRLELTVSDLTLGGQNNGPLRIVGYEKLQEICIWVQHRRVFVVNLSRRVFEIMTTSS